MKILINTSTLVKGGALQVAVSLINELLIDNHGVDFSVICSKQVERELKLQNTIFPSNFYVLKQTPAKLKSRKNIQKKLSKIEQIESPDVVFTIFGPSYWKPKSIHVCGFADGWCYYPESLAFNQLSVIQKIKRKFLSKYKLFYLKKSSDFIIVETKDAKYRLAKILNFELNKVFVVGNSYNRLVYENVNNLKKIVDIRIKGDNVNVLTISAYYPHKNLEIINKLALCLPVDSNLRFIITIDDHDFQKYFKQTTKIINLGPLSVVDCPSVYRACDIVLMPSLLETFSANYPEAMFMKKPIITTNSSFARDICGEAAVYYEPNNVSDLKNKLLSLANNADQQNLLIELGYQRLKNLTKSNERAKEYLNIFKTILMN